VAFHIDDSGDLTTCTFDPVVREATVKVTAVSTDLDRLARPAPCRSCCGPGGTSGKPLATQLPDWKRINESMLKRHILAKLKEETGAALALALMV